MAQYSRGMNAIETLLSAAAAAAATTITTPLTTKSKPMVWAIYLERGSGDHR